MKKFGVFAYHVLLFFTLLGVFFLPFSFRYLHVQSVVTKFLFEDLILFIAAHLENVYVANPAVSSDSTTLYLLFGILFFAALILVSAGSFLVFWKIHQSLIVKIIQLILTYYLAIILLKYGFDKIFKAQFYLPEPNTLYTPLGMLDKDILYWSTMGSSYSYNVFMGAMEVIPALMLLYHKTRTLGLFILLGVLINIVGVNFSFDISVKLFSSFLLLINLLLLVPSFKSLVQFFVLNKATLLPSLAGKELISSNRIRLFFKSIIIIFFFTESLLPYIQSGQYNDDNAPKNYLHGAYQIAASEIDTTQEVSENLGIKRIFIHRHNYLIFQYEDDEMEDFSLEINPSQKQFILTSYDGEIITLEYSYLEDSKSLELRSKELGWTIYFKAVDWRELPLLQPLFHWTVDGV